MLSKDWEIINSAPKNPALEAARDAVAGGRGQALVKARRQAARLNRRPNYLYQGYRNGKPLLQAPGGQPFPVGQSVTNGALETGQLAQVFLSPGISQTVRVSGMPWVRQVVPPAPKEPLANIKYIYTIFQGGIQKIFVGGWQQRSVEITPLVAEGVGEFAGLEFVSIDNLGGDDYGVDLGRAWFGIPGEFSDGFGVTLRHHYERITSKTKRLMIRCKTLNGGGNVFGNASIAPENNVTQSEQTDLSSAYHHCGYSYYYPFLPLYDHYLGSDGYWYCQGTFLDPSIQSALLRHFFGESDFGGEYFAEVPEGSSTPRGFYKKALYPNARNEFNNPFVFQNNFGETGALDTDRIALCRISPDGTRSIGLRQIGALSPWKFFVARGGTLTQAPDEFLDYGTINSFTTVRTAFDWQKNGSFTAIDCDAAYVKILDALDAGNSGAIELDYDLFNPANLSQGKRLKAKVYPPDQEGDSLDIWRFSVFV